jgi:hypothetical protein
MILKPFKLITAGCSFTRHCWTTWADILGIHFSSHVNVGQGGSDNASNVRRIIDVVEPGDIVVMLWTGFDRWSFYSNEEVQLPGVANNHWKHTGSLCNTNKEFFVNYYHKIERFQTTMDYSLLLDQHSKFNNYQVYNFSAFPFMLGECEKKIDPEILKIYNKYNIPNDYRLEESMEEYMLNNNQRQVVSHCYTKNDSHPLPITHWEYVEKYIAPKLDITLNFELKEKLAIEQYNITQFGKLKHEIIDTI